MSRTAANVRSGPGAVYYAAYGTALPNLETDASAIITDTEMTTATYTLIGYTEDGLEATLGTDVFKHEVNEELAPIGGSIQSVSGQLKFTLAESDTAALAMALNNAAVSTTAAGASQAGYTQSGIDVTTNSVSFLTFALLGTSPGGFSKIWVAPKVARNGSFSAPFKKGGKTVIQCTFDLYIDTTQSTAAKKFFYARDYTAVPTS